ncbi:hypothetical protein JIN84_15745 [Luteolibacter yonseiensis]|uniref:Uncharacterized protein n=1 Tax=Luteolibacter yonseiensis TaxID=1144680 RepID=A0A934R506_9BACT|nr:hypothetical protein [Luteolibacter yonseiensis]MBK1817077.1 hypothetical protein [Luteolibacter yonseiensis]
MPQNTKKRNFVRWSFCLALIAMVAFMAWEVINGFSPAVFLSNLRFSQYDSKIRFWGKVMDSDGYPLEGVYVKAVAITYRIKKTPEGDVWDYPVVETRTKSDGSFVLDGMAGFVLKIEKMSKQGYVLPRATQISTTYPGGSNREYRFKSMDPHEPVFSSDPSKPVEFRLWKLKKPEPLSIGRAVLSIRVGEPARYFSLVSRNYPEQAIGRFKPDVKISISRIGEVRPPRWEVKIEGYDEDCGVMKADPKDPFMFTAPEEGYQQSITYEYGPDCVNEFTGLPGFPVRFFARSKNKYWHAAVDSVFQSPVDNEESPQIDIWTNLNKSRNLEHDAVRPLPDPPLGVPEDYGLKSLPVSGAPNYREGR